MRKYKSGMRWCFMRWTEVRSAYIKRLHILKTPWFAICLHWIMRPDPEPYLHDHPVTFLSLVLRGSYAERRHLPTHPNDGGYDIKVHRWFNFLRATPDDRHQIIYTRRNTLTLCFMGPVRRTWGYHTDEGWISWKRYEHRMKAEARFEEWLDKQSESLSAIASDDKEGSFTRAVAYFNGKLTTVDEDTRLFVDEEITR